MTIQLEEETTVQFEFDCRKLAKDAVSFVLDYEKFPYEAQVSLTLTDNASIQEINSRFRQIDKPTDVLSFPLLSLSKAGDFSCLAKSPEDNFDPDSGEAMLGDIVISVPKVFEQANEYGHSEKREFAFLVVHSVLHLLGYDHINPEDAACMEKKQEQILNAMGILR